MGRVAAPFGVRGAVRVQPYTAAPDGLLDYPVWWLRRNAAESWSERRVRSGRMHGDTVLAEFEGVDTREAAATLRGAEVGIPRAALPAPSPGEVYWSDLVGLEVVNRQGVSLGRVQGLLETGAHPLLRVARPGAPERLIPCVDAFVDRVDAAAGRIEVDWDASY